MNVIIDKLICVASPGLMFTPAAKDALGLVLKHDVDVEFTFNAQKYLFKRDDVQAFLENAKIRSVPMSKGS